MKIKIQLLVLLLFFTTPIAALAKVHEFMLANGMKLLVVTDHRFPVAIQQIWYQVGSSYEHNGITGISHMLEHLLFKGSKRFPNGAFSKIIAANGGRENAFTSSDYTAYFQHLEKSRLAIAMELEADRMRNTLFSLEDFVTERDVVTEERRLRTEDNPMARLYEQFLATAYVTSPYHHPVIGWMDDILNYDLQDVNKWYQRWYHPNNATLIIAGDVQPQAVLQLAQKYYEPIQASPITSAKPRPAIEQSGQRRVTLNIPASIKQVILGYKVPSIKTADDPDEAYALEVLSWILDGGGSARISRELLRGKQLIASGSVGYNPYSKLQTLFTLSAVPAKNQAIEVVETALRKQIDRLHKELVSEQELATAKTQIITSRVYQRDSLFYQAMQLGILESIGVGWQIDKQFNEKIQAVTAQQIQKVAKRYLQNNYLTIATLKPQPLSKK